MASNSNINKISAFDYVLLENIGDEVIFIGPDKRIKWLNSSAKKMFDVVEGALCYKSLCHTSRPCEGCILTGGGSNQCNAFIQNKSEKIIANYSVGEYFKDGVLLVYGDKSIYSGNVKSDVEAISENEKLFHEANHDQLTSLYNRRYMDYIFTLIDNDKRKQGRNLRAFTVIDIDKFKHINDAYGHSVGDEVLKVLAYRISSEIRKTDIAIRMGGDEFLIVHSQHREEDILGFIKRLLAHMNKPILLEDGRMLNVTISMGVLLNAQKYANLIEALKYADHALYEAKARSNSTSNYVFFGKDLEKEITYARELAENLDRAVTQNDLTVHYQPIISLKDEKIYGIEAFVRWITEDGHKRYSPEQFLAVAESRNTIIEIGQQLMQQVFLDINKYQKYLKRYNFLSINFSEKQFMSEPLSEMIYDLSLTTDFDISKLQIEVTEGSLLNNTPEAKKMVKKFRDAGVEIILDNFGKGYSSLSSLIEYDIKKIKIDNKIIGSITENEQYRRLVETLVSIANIHDIEVIAKGVETYEQLEAVKQLGCHYAQGFYICVPQPITKYLSFAKEYYMEQNQIKLIWPESKG